MRSFFSGFYAEWCYKGRHHRSSHAEKQKSKSLNSANSSADRFHSIAALDLKGGPSGFPELNERFF